MSQQGNLPVDKKFHRVQVKLDQGFYDVLNKTYQAQSDTGIPFKGEFFGTALQESFKNAVLHNNRAQELEKKVADLEAMRAEDLKQIEALENAKPKSNTKALAFAFAILLSVIVGLVYINRAQAETE